MSVERFLMIVNPLNGYARLNLNSARKTMIIIWTIGIMLAVLPGKTQKCCQILDKYNKYLFYFQVIYWRNTTMFYGINTGMCFPLYISDKYPIGWQYSVFVFLVLNLIE